MGRHVTNAKPLQVERPSPLHHQLPPYLFHPHPPPMALQHSLLARKFSTDFETPAAFSLVKLRLPISLHGPGSLIESSAVTGATRRNYHTAIVRSAMPDVTRRCINIQVWAVPSYSFASSGTTWLATQPEDFRNRHIPFPCHEDNGNLRPTPTSFGEPLRCGGYNDRRPGWVFLKEINFELPFTQTVCLQTQSSSSTH